MIIKNKTFDEIKIGDSAFIIKKITKRDIEIFSILSGDISPIHVDEKFAKKSMYHKRILHGMFLGSLIATIIEMKLPGPGSVYLSQLLEFKKPVFLEDKIEVKVTVIKKIKKTKIVILNCVCQNQKKQKILIGKANVIAPLKKVEKKSVSLAKLDLYNPGQRNKKILQKAFRIKKRFKMGIINPIDEPSFLSAFLAAEKNIITPIFIGSKSKIKSIAKKFSKDISNYEVIDAKSPYLATKIAVDLVKEKKVQSLMKGHIHTDVMMKIIVSKEGLRTDTRMSHCWIVDVPNYEKHMIISDMAINIAPNLEEKKAIIQNAIHFSHSLGLKKPKVAILSAVETVLENIPSTVDAAILCKMAQRGQIKGGELEGPLSFDTAISKDAAMTKHLKSKMSCCPDIFIVPNLEAGNIVIKELDYLSHGEGGGIVLGAMVPIALTSRASSVTERLLSCALAKIYAAWSNQI